MSDVAVQPQAESQQERVRKRDIAAKYLKQGLSEGETFVKQNLSDGELALKRAAGLGKTPNVVPTTPGPLTNIDPRPIHVGWHPVGGAAGKWFANDTGLGKLITDKINKYPDPTQHWAVLVGEYAHQLWMDENFDVIYTNTKVVVEEWTVFKVGHTRFNDDAVRRTGEMVIEHTREKQAAYNLISNNCQTYALRLLDAIKADGASKFPTTLDVYDRLFGAGKVMDLFNPNGIAVADTASGSAPVDPNGDEAVATAESVMQQHTAQLDPHASPVEAVKEGPGGVTDKNGSGQQAAEGANGDSREMVEGEGEEVGEDGKKKKRGLFARILRKN